MNRLFVLMGLLLLQPLSAAAQSPDREARIRAALLPLPPAMKAEAGVLVEGPDGGVERLRDSENGYSCLLRDPGRSTPPVFDARCYSDELWPAIFRRWELSGRYESGAEATEQLHREIEEGSVELARRPTAGYRALGPLSSYDVVRDVAGPGISTWESVHFPFRTAAEVGIPTESTPRSGDPVPWVMASGSWWSHVMIVHGPPGGGSPPPVAFTDVTVVPMDSERLIPGQTVVVRGGRISWMGPAAEAPVPEDAEMVDGTGRYLMPGLVDAHVHANNPRDPRIYVANGITTVRNLWGGPFQLRLRQEARAAPDVVLPTIYTAGPLIDGPPPIWESSAVAATPEEGRALVQAHADAGYDFIKVYNRLSAETWRAIMEAADRRGLPVDGHVPVEVGLREVLGRGQRAIEHLRGYLDAVVAETPTEEDDDAVRALGDRAEIGLRMARGEITLDEVLDPAALRTVAEATAAAGTWNIPTVVVYEGVAEDEYADRVDDEGMEYVTPETRSRWNPAGSRFSGLTSDERRGLRAFDIAFAYRMMAALHEAGAGLLVGTDTPNPFVLPGFSIHQELEHFVQAGFTPYEALERATRIPAEFMGTDDDVGVVSPGMRADLLLLDSNPLEDVAALRSPVGVVLRGNWLDAAELEAILAEAREEIAASGR